ncbi:MAG: SDR family NAD(P)-dependent oxidoreductase [Planctomycetota bacterium]
MPTDPRYHDLKGRRVCVTGGAGFIGSHLVDALLDAGADVAVIDDLSNGREANLDQVRDRITFVQGSILDQSALAAAMRDVDIVFHEAAVTSVPRSVEQPARSIEVNAVGTRCVLDAARAAGASRVVFAASSSAYGERDEAIKTETMSSQPMSPYAAAKCAGELLLQTYCSCYGMSGVSLRYFNIFGSRQRADSDYAAVIPKFISLFRSGTKPKIYGDGTQTRDFTHVRNAVHANMLAAVCAEPLRGDVINVACGESTTLLELVTRLASLLGVDPDVEFAPPRIGEILHSRADIQRARDVLGYDVVMPLDDGLRDVVEASREL